MASKRFDSEGKLIIPEFTDKKRERKTELLKEIPEIIKEVRTLYIIKQVFCPGGDNLIDKSYEISGYPAIRLRYLKPEGQVAEVALSAILGDPQSVVIDGELKWGEFVDIHCPVCNVKLPILTKRPDPESKSGEHLSIVLLFLTPDLDYTKAITFCNKVGTVRSFINYAGTLIQNIYKQMPDFG